jgi:hypothetical protein
MNSPPLLRVATTEGERGVAGTIERGLEGAEPDDMTMPDHL